MSRRPVGDPQAAIRRRGLLLVLSSPSGAGKTTITRLLLQRDPTLSLSVSVTTRPPRPRRDRRPRLHLYRSGAVRRDGRGRTSCSSTRPFSATRYGTPRRPIEAALAAGRDVVTDIDWQGTQQLSQAMPEDLVKVFVLPPSIAALRDRLQRRAQDSAETVAARMAKSAEEMSHWPEYDYVIVNRDIDESVAEVAAIVTAERRRRTRQLGLAEFVNRLAGGVRPAFGSMSTRTRASAQNSATESSSARAVGGIPAAASSSSHRDAERLEAGAQHLAALAEGGGGDPFEGRLRGRGQRRGARHQR